MTDFANPVIAQLGRRIRLGVVGGGAGVAAVECGLHILCDKPLTTTLADATDLAVCVREAGVVFAFTHNYSGYPMVREARAMIAAGELG